MSLADLIAGKLPTAVGSVAKVARVAVANPAERKSAKPTTAHEPAIEAVPVVSKRKSAETIQPRTPTPDAKRNSAEMHQPNQNNHPTAEPQQLTPQPESLNALLSGEIATATVATFATQGHTEPLPGGEVATATVATFATHDREAMRAALAEAGEGLPVTVAELVREYGEEGAEEFAGGYDCTKPHLRAFAEAVAERLEREPKPEPPPPPPHPLDGLALLREDWRFVERRTGGRHREALLNEYACRWKEAAALEPVEFRKANAGRFAANTWLRGVGR